MFREELIDADAVSHRMTSLSTCEACASERDVRP
jgi:hypothetical protein